MPPLKRTAAANVLSLLMAGQANALSASASLTVSIYLNPARDAGCVSQLLNEPTQATVTVVCPGGNVPVIRPQPPVVIPPPVDVTPPVVVPPIVDASPAPAEPQPDIVAPAPSPRPESGVVPPILVSPVPPRPFDRVNDRLAYWRLPAGGGMGMATFASPYVGTGTVTSLRILTVNSSMDGERLEMLVSF